MSEEASNTTDGHKLMQTNKMNNYTPPNPTRNSNLAPPRVAQTQLPNYQTIPHSATNQNCGTN